MFEDVKNESIRQAFAAIKNAQKQVERAKTELVLRGDDKGLHHIEKAIKHLDTAMEIVLLKL